MIQPTDDALTARQTRRDALADLITRVGRGRAGADIATLITSHLTAEQADADQAHAALVDARYETEGERKRAERAEAERDGAYRERAQLLAWLAALHPAVRTPATDITEPGWQILYLNPTTGGQMSWHIAPRDIELFEHVEYVPAGSGDQRAMWDGHTTPVKYERIASLVRFLADVTEATGTLPCTCRTETTPTTTKEN